MIACSSDEDFNTKEATVEFQSAEIEVKELTSILNLPIVVKGERNGLIKVHVILKENNSGFESEKAILITEDHLSIPMRTGRRCYGRIGPRSLRPHRCRTLDSIFSPMC